MSKKMLIDAAHPEETRVVVVDGTRVEEFDYETSAKATITGNIYLAKVTRVEPSLQAAFVEYGGGRHGFLAFSEIHPDYFQIPAEDRDRLLAAAREAEEEAAREEEERTVARSKRRAAETSSDDKDKGPGRRGRGRGRGRARPTRDDARSLSLDPSALETAQIPEPLLGALANGALTHADQIAAHGPAPSEVSRLLAEADPEAVAAVGAAEAEAAALKAAAAQAGDDDDATDRADDEAETPTDASGGLEAAGDETPSREAAERADLSDRTVSDVEDVLSDFADDARDAEVEGEHDAEESDASIEKVVEALDTGADEENGEIEVSRDAVMRRLQQSLREYKIQEVIKRRQILLVQAVKDERGNKGAALTTYLSLAGRYCVLMPNTARGGGISRKITNAADRKRLKAVANDFEVPEGMGLIIRTAGANRTKPELRRDYEYLLRQWSSIRDLTLRSIAPALIYEEGSLIKRTIRDLYSREIDQVVVDGDDGFAEARDYMTMLIPSQSKTVQRHVDVAPLFVKHQVEAQITALMSPTVQLKSGGYIVIGLTEALVAIDVNSGRSTKEVSIENTALKTNLEAVDEIALQLRLRDLAGLIVIDFIDMEDAKNNRAVEKRLKDKLKGDRARIQIGRISGFGLLEMSRQRLRPALLEAMTTPCEACRGSGVVRSNEAMALSALRVLEEAAGKGRAAALKLVAPVPIANHLLNVKRARIAEVEERTGVELIIVGDPALSGEDHKVEKLKFAQSEERRQVGAPIQIEAGYEEGASDEPAAEAETEAETEAAETQQKSADPRAEDDDGGRKRRGRRGGRRRRKGGDGAEDGAGGDPMPVIDLDDEAAAKSDAAPAEAAADEAAEPEALEPAPAASGAPADPHAERAAAAADEASAQSQLARAGRRLADLFPNQVLKPSRGEDPGPSEASTDPESVEQVAPPNVAKPRRTGWWAFRRGG